MVTPTGAAVLQALAAPAPVPLDFEIQRVGYGAGTKTFSDRPNVLRIMVGDTRKHADAADELIEIADQYRRSQSADLRPSLRAPVRGRRARRDPDADDHEKGPPRDHVAVLAEAALRAAVAAVLFEETTTIGLRSHPVAAAQAARAKSKKSRHALGPRSGSRFRARGERADARAGVR